MSSKQDRQGVRTPADVERKYNIGKIAAQMEKVASKTELLVTARSESLILDKITLDRTFSEIEAAILKGANVRVRLVCKEVSHHIYLQMASHLYGKEVSFFCYFNNSPLVLQITKG